jgi:site-specific recombinase XerD
MPSATRLGSEEAMDQDVERFLRVLEADRGFSVNTIFAYRNDLTQFLTFSAGRNLTKPAEDQRTTTSAR